jgi:hypothetical protein
MSREDVSTNDARSQRRWTGSRPARARWAFVARGVAGVLAVASIAAVSTGCTPVAPYERGKLAHPTMTAADLAGMGEQHLRAIDEGATGGSAGTGSGCGCN